LKSIFVRIGANKTLLALAHSAALAALLKRAIAQNH
jgi:hypothetical protein